MIYNFSMHSLADRSNHWKYFYEKLNMNRTVAFLWEFLEKLLKQRSEADRLADTELTSAGGSTKLLNTTISTFHPSSFHTTNI